MTVLEVAVALLVRDGRWFLQRRDPRGPVLPGLWELPGGKLRAGESPESALRRELGEELGWTPALVEPLGPLDHNYPDGAVRLHLFRCDGPERPATALAWGWFRPVEARRLPQPEATRRLLERTGA